jgi:hypothetical protein
MDSRIVVSLESPPDREKLVASIIIDHKQMAELNEETAELVVELYPRRDGKPWVLAYGDLIDALAKAKLRLGR